MKVGLIPFIVPAGVSMKILLVGGRGEEMIPVGDITSVVLSGAPQIGEEELGGVIAISPVVVDEDFS